MHNNVYAQKAPGYNKKSTTDVPYILGWMNPKAGLCDLKCHPMQQ
jgi:hypothetical protein